MEPEALLADLNDAQRTAVTSDAEPLCIIAGAGSGKTRVLTRRIAHRCATGSADPRHVLALTFTRKAAGELSTRLRTLGLRDRITAGTFHATAYAQLRHRWAERQIQPPELLTSKVRVLGKLLPRRPPGQRAAQVMPSDLALEIEWAKARIVAPSAYAAAATAAGRKPPLGPEAMAGVYARYQEELRNARLVDFDDLLDLCTRAMESDEDFAAGQRWQFRHLFVDEFQDVNPLQFRLLETWRGSSSDLCVVGDPNQAIYAWNGADPELLRNFGRRFPGSGVVELGLNYRSTPQILAAANAVIEPASRGVVLRPFRTPGDTPSVVGFVDDRAEARGVARRVLDLHIPGRPWSRQAVLVRTNAQTVLLAEAFRAVRIPFRLRGGQPFLELPEVRAALRDIRRARGLAAGLAALEASIETSEGEPAQDTSDAETIRRDNLAELLRLASEYSATDQFGSVGAFESWLAATVGADSGSPGSDTVEIATFHAAKGLEWSIVHVCGLETGLVPISHAKTQEAREEERRLFYVAVTRAEDALWLSWAAERSFRGRVSSRNRSPFLDELVPVLTAMAEGADPADWREHLPVSRAALTERTPNTKLARAGLDDPGDVALFDALKAWRLTRARAANVPAYVIFPDATLAELARRRPDDHPGLLAVSGIGPAKATRFGGDVLAVIAEHDR